MNTVSFDAALVGNNAQPTLLARIAAWFAQSLKSSDNSWADGTRGL